METEQFLNTDFNDSINYDEFFNYHFVVCRKSYSTAHHSDPRRTYGIPSYTLAATQSWSSGVIVKSKIAFSINTKFVFICLDELLSLLLAKYLVNNFQINKKGNSVVNDRCHQTHVNSVIFEHTEEVDSLCSRKVTSQHSFYFKHLNCFCILIMCPVSSPQGCHTEDSPE